MTPVPVVSATLTTRTQRRWELQVDDPKTRFLTKTWKADGPWVEDSMHLGVRTGVSTTVRRVRERLTVDPVFVPLPEAPDLTCRTCKGKGRKPGTPISGFRPQLHCTSCGGTGVSPVYAATWQCRWVKHGTPTEYGEWRTPACVLDNEQHERRQVIQWRATDVTVLPVVDQDDPIACLDFGDDRTHLLVVIGDDDLWDVTDEPWAADLEVGQFVLRLDGWEHLQQPHTEAVCSHCGGRLGDPDRLDEAFWHNGCVEPGSIPECPVCSGKPDTDGYPTGRVPLSVPDGVLSWIDLA